MRRFFGVLIAAAALGACEAQVNGERIKLGEGGPYVLSIAARGEGESVILLRGPDGKAAAALVEGGASSLLTEGEAQALFAEAAPNAAIEGGERVDVKLPGLQITAVDDAGAGEERARVSIGFGKSRIEVDAQAGSEERAILRISGMDAAAARDFLREQDEFSEEIKAAMLAELGL